MAVAMEVILLERVDNLGAMGEKVRVKPGYARNYLLPQGKALRVTKDNLAYFESQRAALEKQNDEKRSAAEKVAKKIEGLKAIIIRHASESGHLYGSVTSRDVAEAVAAQGKVEISRGQVKLNDSFKSIGLFPVAIALHGEVKATVMVNIARSEEEAKVQAKTGRALIVTEGQKAEAPASAEDARAAFLDDEALRAEREGAEAEAQDEAEENEERARKSAKRAAKKSAKKSDESEEDAGEE